VLAITSADDERNPPTLDLMAPAIARIPARHLVVPPSAGTSGHGSLMDARFCADALAALLREAPRLA
jgi:homoserine O-acetyltransferase